MRKQSWRATCIAVGLVNEGITIADGEIKGERGKHRGVLHGREQILPNYGVPRELYNLLPCIIT